MPAAAAARRPPSLFGMMAMRAAHGVGNRVKGGLVDAGVKASFQPKMPGTSLMDPVQKFLGGLFGVAKAAVPRYRDSWAARAQKLYRQRQAEVRENFLKFCQGQGYNPVEIEQLPRNHPLKVDLWNKFKEHEREEKRRQTAAFDAAEGPWSPRPRPR